MRHDKHFPLLKFKLTIYINPLFHLLNPLLLNFVLNYQLNHLFMNTFLDTFFTIL